jgi:Ca-activated chloride channel family protein
MRAALALAVIPLLAAAALAQSDAQNQSQNQAIPAAPVPHTPPSAPAQDQGTAGQPAQQQQTAPPRIVVPTNLVVVPVTVKDSRGQLVSGLTRDDFRIIEDNVDRRVIGFSSDPVPISAVVLVDNDLSDKQVKQVQASLKTIAAAFGPNDEVALVTYDQYPTTVLDFTNQNDKLYTQLTRVELGSHNTFVYPDPATAGPTNVAPNDPTSAVRVKGPPKYENTSFLDDALYAAGQMLKNRGRDRRKIIFLVSDGSNARNNKHPYEETLTSLLESDVSVYSISVTHTVPLGKSLVQHGASELDNYAAKTGGDTFFAAKQEDLDRMYSNVTEEARNEYTLTFQPGNTDASKDYHSIDVRVENHGNGLQVRARDGFYLSALGIGH